MSQSGPSMIGLNKSSKSTHSLVELKPHHPEYEFREAVQPPYANFVTKLCTHIAHL